MLAANHCFRIDIHEDNVVKFANDITLPDYDVCALMEALAEWEF
jgi:hypothetical protein